NSQYTVEWSINNGGVISTQTGCSIDVVWAAAGPYHISAVQHIISNGEIACSSPATNLEINTGTPEVEILPNENPCPSSIVEYHVSPAGWTSYNWIAPANGSIVSINGTSSISIQWFDVQAPTPDVVTVEVNNNECVPPITLDVIITPFELEINADDICADDLATITSNAASADSYKWFVNNELVGTNVSLNYIFPTSGFYNIRLETVNPNGCMGIFKKAITIYVNPNPNPAISRVIEYCRDNGTLAGTLYATPNSPDYTYQWLLNGNEINGANSPVLDITQTGTYTVMIDYGLCENSSSIVIECEQEECDCTIDEGFDVFQIDYLDYDGTCGSIGFSGTIIDLSDAVFANWIIEGPNNYSDVIPIQSESDLTISGFQLPQLAGLYTVYLEACIPCIDSEGCCIISERERIVIPFIPEFDFTFSCAGENTYDLTLLDVSSYYVSSDNVNIQWDVNGIIYNGSTVNISGLNPGTTIDIGLLINATEYPAYSCDLFEEVDLPESVNGTFTFEGGLCADQAITFTPAMDVEELLEWEWVFNDEITILSYSPQFSFEEAGTHQVTLNLTSVYGCTTQYTEMITVGDPLEGEIEKTMENCDAQATLSYTQTSGDPVTDYLWGPSGETSPAIEVIETGIYTVTVINTEGCMAIASTVVDLNNPFLNGINGPSEICEGENAALIVDPSPSYDFEWDISPCPVAICPIPGNAIGLASWEPNTYTITVKALQGGEECLSETTTLVVHDVPNFYISQDVTQCEPFSVTLQTVFTDGENNGTIEWSSNTVGIPEGITGTIFTASQNGNYQATYTDDITGCTVSRFGVVRTDIDFSLFPVGCYDYCADELAENPIEIPGINSCNSSYEWQINYGDGYEILYPPGAGTVISYPCDIPSATISGLPEGETEAKIRLIVDNGICVEESEEVCITVEECCETCPKILNLRCEEILENGDVVFAIDGDLACLPEGYEFCGTPPVITNGGYLEIDEESVVIYEPPMFDPLYWFAGTLVVTNFDYFVANGGLEAEIDICNGDGICKAQFFIAYENGGGEANIDITCVADPDECTVDVYDISAEIPIPLGWSYCGDEPLVTDGGYLEINSISSSCDQISFSGRLFVTNPDFYQNNQGLELSVNICQGGETQTITAQIPYESCDNIWPYPYRLTNDCIENQEFVELCLFTPYFTACNPCEEQPLEVLILGSNPINTLYSGFLGTSEEDYECIEFVIPESGYDLVCINFYVFNDCYGSAWSVCYGSNCGGDEGLRSIGIEHDSGYQDSGISFDLMPNPASNQVNVQLKTDITDPDLEGKILLQDIFGRTHTQKVVQLQDDSNVQLDLSNLAAGVYWVILKNEAGLLQSKKLVKF
ncbi:MAG: hypothetical protein MI974_06610, partial [Chitinophagales bacterium]|nr:hypothetical protein [Chitinophagales bacterium]